MISVPQFCRKREEDYSCISWKFGKVEKEKALNHYKQKSDKNGSVRKFKEI